MSEKDRPTDRPNDSGCAECAALRAEVERLKEQLESPFMDGYETAKEEYRPRLIAAEAEVERLTAERDRQYDQNAEQITRIAALEAENERLLAVLDLYREAVRIDATMEGPKFMGSNASALKRAWDADRAAITQENTND